MIYKHHLVSSQPIELWAESGEVYKNQKLRRRNKAIMNRTVFAGRRRCVNLGLLRTCKQVNMEGAEIFYGHNEFRFSGKNGHMAAFAFVTKIGPRNLDFMKTITCALPLRSSDEGMYGENWNPTCWKRIHEIYDRMPFPYSPKVWRYRKLYKRLDFQDAWYKLAEKLIKAYALEHVTFVLPECSYFSYDDAKHPPYDALGDLCAAKPLLELHVVRMMNIGDGNKLSASSTEVIGKLKQLGLCRVHLAAFDPDGCWALPPQPYVDKRGAFTKNKDLDRTVEVIDVLLDLWRLYKTT